MKYLGIDAADLVKMGGIHTATEICQQPEIWRQIWEMVDREDAPVRQFLAEAFACSKQIILTGAGTSAFIGLSLQGAFQRNTGITTHSVPTTDIVSHPNDYFLPGKPVLIISFARSGNSPESSAVLALADSIYETCYHLVITCNADGNLANYVSRSKKHVFILPAQANDQSLAMTSSYSGMLLAGLLFARIMKPDSLYDGVQTIIRYGEKLISQYASDLKAIAKKDFKRAVFLGSGPLSGTATESHLKMQELTNGRVICKNDSYLGFRHGPKSVIDEHTLVVYILSSNEYAYQYEKDLMDSMKKGTAPLMEIAISEAGIAEPGFQHVLRLSENGRKTEDELLAVCYILPAQILSFYKSIDLGLRPDAPSANDAITRVVEGVNIYSMS
jgi:tagatose-6-phosphate ketose/aldose isomerase